ncbi:MAG: ABC transporter ATP-binding protein/permease [Clostridia bacterium]|nr:ABC transporter ATP-binding protein/permease [Clostridia bacterium]
MLDKRLFKLLGGNKKYIFIVVALMVVGLLASVGTTACICFAINLAFHGEKAFSKYVLPLVAAVACVLIRYAVSRINGDLKDILGRNIKKELRSKAYDKIVKLGVKEADGIGMAGLTQTSMEGIEQLDIYFTTYIPQFFFAMIAPFVLFIITVWIDWRVALVLLAMVPLIPMSIIAVSKYAKKIFAKYWGKYISMGGEFLDSVQGLKELKIFKADARQHNKINESAEEFRKITMKVLIMQLASTTIMDTVAYGGAGLGIMMVILNLANGWGFGGGVAPVAGALFLILVAVDFFLPLRAFGSAFHVGMNGASAGRNLLSILELEEPTWGDRLVDGKEIELKDVTFSYDGQRDVLKHVDMSFSEKGMTAIVGESGCGKSTVVNMIVGAFTPSGGEITVGGTPIHDYSLASYYGALSVVSYNTYLFNSSVRDNFRLAKPTVTDEEIFDALKNVNLDKFILSEGGLDKVINEDAENISGGQKQRLAMAVNLVADKKIYVFDEATSNIDIESEAIIMDNIRTLAKEKTVIVISHRLENVVHADRIYFMDAGEVKECGTHQELMTLDGGYKKLYSMQKMLEEGYFNDVNITAAGKGYELKGGASHE